jgi:DNA-binding LytR/AlgR family response regulator
VRVIGVDEIDFLQADGKYTRIGWRGDAGPAADALVRTPLKELLAQLDPDRFVQVHRAVVVNLRAVDHVVRHDNDTARIHLKGRTETLPVSRAFVHVFRQM